MSIRQTFIKVVAVPALIAGVGLLTGCDGDPDLSHAGNPAPRTAAPVASSTPRDTSTTETASVSDNFITTGHHDDGTPILDNKKGINGYPIFVKNYGPIDLKIDAKADKGTLEKGKQYQMELFWYSQHPYNPEQHGMSIVPLDNNDGSFNWSAHLTLPPEGTVVWNVVQPLPAPADPLDWSHALIVSCHTIRRDPNPTQAAADFAKDPEQ